jgi:hypothetical protein
MKMEQAGIGPKNEKSPQAGLGAGYARPGL